jgi:hypothetical protein
MGAMAKEQNGHLRRRKAAKFMTELIPFGRCEEGCLPRHLSGHEDDQGKGKDAKDGT